MKKGSNKAKTRHIHEMELRKHRLKVNDQHKQLLDCARENQALHQTVDNLMAVHAAIMAAVTLRFGEQAEDGTIKLVLPPVEVGALAEQYEIGVGRMEDKSMVIRMREKRLGPGN